MSQGVRSTTDPSLKRLHEPEHVAPPPTTATPANTPTANTPATITPTSITPVRSVGERIDARTRFTSETGAGFRAFQLQQQPLNTSSIGALSSATKIGTSPPPGVPTLGDVHAAIQGFARDPNIPFSYVPDGCYARADVMANSLNANGIPTSKIWAYAQDWNKPLEVPGAEWGYHVAPQVRAWNPQNGAVDNYVVDPSMSGKPMTPAEWVNKMNPHQGPVRVDVTGNEAYVPDGAGGYHGVNHPEVQNSGLGPQQTFRNYSNEMTSQGLSPNSGPPDGIPTNAEVAASKTGTFARVGSAVSRGLGGLAAVGGGIQFAHGVSEWNHGNKLDGGVDMAAGGLNTAGGLAMATGVGTVAAPFLFGASSAIDGGRDLYHGIKNGDGEKIGVGTAKVAGGGMMIAGGVLCATGVGVPVGAALIVGGAVVSGGAALYDAFHDKINNAVSSAWKSVTSWF